MRVYEYAKQHSISNKDLIQFLREKGFDVSSHMAVLPADALPVLAARYERKVEKAHAAATPIEKPIEKPAEKKVETKVEEKIEKKIIAPAPAPSPKKVDESKPPISRAAHPAKVVGVESVPVVEPEGMVIQSMTVGDFATRSKKPVSEVILTLLRQGVVAVKNQIISEAVVGQLVKHFGIKAREAEAKARPSAPNVRADVSGHTEERLPVVVVIGHVDHGKTTLLDFIRKTRVAARERGGITQHLGAYEAHTRHGNVVFLDTPGHGAFTKMRERGTRVADIAILVVAADDGIMPQSVEAIKQAQAAKIPLVVAINKIDKASPQQIEAVKRGLAQYGLVPEDWGGQAICMPVSAKVGTGVDELLEVVVLQSKLMELSAVLDVPARGYILEAKKEKGRGPVATVLCQHGILRVGDSFVSGATSGKVTSLINSWGKRVNEVHPSQPVQVAGFDDLPQAGEPFEVVDATALKKLRQGGTQRVNVMTKSMQGQGLGLNILLKVDNDSSREAVLDALDKINNKAYTKLHVIAAAIGNVSESDVQLAHDTSASIYMLHAKAEAGALVFATKYGVALHHYDIIYKLLESLEESAALGKPVKMITKKIGEAIVLKVFDIKNLGVIAGAQVRTGRLIRDGKVSIWRGKNKIAEGTIKSLQREKKTIKEATAGYECAFMVEGFDAWLPDDRVECYQEVPE